MPEPDKNCLITGAAGGIGSAMVREFSNAGYQVIGLDLTPRPRDLDCAFWFQMDLAKVVKEREIAEPLFLQLRNATASRGLDVLINNAATQLLGSMDMLTQEEWQRTLDVNVTAPFLLVKELLPALEKRNGCVINIGSIHARLTKKGFVAYATSKAALNGMTRSMAIDLGGRIRVNCIEPAAIETPMLKSGFLNKKAEYEKLERYHPTSRIGRPDEVARLALAIAGEEMGFLHGAIIGLDGGISSCLHDPDA